MTFYDNGQCMKNLTYGQVEPMLRQIFLTSAVDDKSRLLRELASNWAKNHPLFWQAASDVIQRKKTVKTCALAWIMSSITFISSFPLLSYDSLSVNVYATVILQALQFFSLGGLGFGITGAILGQSRPAFKAEVEDFFSALKKVLEEVAEYRRHRSGFILYPISLLRVWDFAHLSSTVDQMLVSLAEKVKTLEKNGNIGDPAPELITARCRQGIILRMAAALGLAEKNPQTYFECPVPAQASKAPGQTAP